MAFYEYEPWGRNAETVQLAAVGEAAANAFGKSGKNIDHFLRKEPEWWTEDDFEAGGLARAFKR